MPKRTIPFLIAIGLFGIGLGYLVNTLDPLFYSEKIRQLAPPTIKNTVLSFITIMALLVALITQPLVGRWSDHTKNRWGRRTPFLVGGVIGLAVSLGLIAVAETLWLLVGAAMLISASSNTVQGVWQALIPDRVPDQQRGTAAAIKTLLEGAGAIIGVSVAGVAVIQGYLTAIPLIGILLFSLILVVTLYALRRDQPAIREEQPPKRRSTSEIRPSLNFPIKSYLKAVPRYLHHLRVHPPAFFWWIINRLLFWSAGIAVRTFVINYAEDGLNLPLAALQTVDRKVYIFLGGGIILLVMGAGAAADRLGRRPLLVAAGLLGCAGTISLIVAQELPILLVGAGLLATGAGIYSSASWALATDLAPQAKSALYLGIANGATVIGSISGRLGGPVIDGINQLSGSNSTGYLTVFWIAALFFAGSSFVILKIRPGSPGPSVE
ncbi:MAG: MFS transporter [Anaerolineae bacterium]|nr:MFS transporter [Anaerolineae bacterium]